VRKKKLEITNKIACGFTYCIAVGRRALKPFLLFTLTSGSNHKKAVGKYHHQWIANTLMGEGTEREVGPNNIVQQTQQTETERAGKERLIITKKCCLCQTLGLSSPVSGGGVVEYLKLLGAALLFSLTGAAVVYHFLQQLSTCTKMGEADDMA